MSTEFKDLFSALSEIVKPSFWLFSLPRHPIVGLQIALLVLGLFFWDIGRILRQRVRTIPLL